MYGSTQDTTLFSTDINDNTKKDKKYHKSNGKELDLNRSINYTDRHTNVYKYKEIKPLSGKREIPIKITSMYFNGMNTAKHINFTIFNSLRG